MERSKVVTLFCVYTGLSIGISVSAWIAVALGFVYVSPSVLVEISFVDWIFGACIYCLGAYLIYELYHQRLNLFCFATYVLVQSYAVGQSFLVEGVLYFAAAGSQGTFPAVFISVAMLFYLTNSHHRLGV